MKKTKDKYGSFNIKEPFEFIDNPIISVIMGTYNSEQFLERAIDSILNQTYKNFEFIIINDGSSDKSMQIIEKYLNNNKILLINQENMGLTKSLNRGINLARGKYIARQDADDESLPNRFEKQIQVIENNNVNLLTSHALKNDKLAPPPFVIKWNSLNILKQGNLFIHGTFFGEKELFEKVKYNEEYYYAQDFIFILETIKQNYKIGFIKESLYISHNPKGNITTKYSNKQFDFANLAIKNYYGNFYANFAKLINNIPFIFFKRIIKYFYILFLYFLNPQNKIKLFK